MSTSSASMTVSVTCVCGKRWDAQREDGGCVRCPACGRAVFAPDVGESGDDPRASPAKEDECAGFYQASQAAESGRPADDAPAGEMPHPRETSWREDWIVGTVACVIIGTIGGGVLADLGVRWWGWGKGWALLAVLGVLLLSLSLALFPLKSYLRRRGDTPEPRPQPGTWPYLKAMLHVMVPAWAVAGAVLAGYIEFQSGTVYGVVGALIGLAGGACIGALLAVAGFMGIH